MGLFHLHGFIKSHFEYFDGALKARQDAELEHYDRDFYRKA